MNVNERMIVEECKIRGDRESVEESERKRFKEKVSDRAGE